MLTYRELLHRLQELPEGDLDLTATVTVDEEEFFGISSIKESTQENDVLDEGHPYITVM